jgi:hypothetical protein
MINRCVMAGARFTGGGRAEADQIPFGQAAAVAAP